MKKKVLILMLGFLLIGVNLIYAAGDLTVMGNLGLGTTPNTWKMRLLLPATTGNAFLFESQSAQLGIIGRFDSPGVNIFQQRSFNNTPSFAPRFEATRGRGDLVNKSNVLANDVLYEVVGKGWGGGQGHDGGAVRFEAAEDWNYNTHGTRFGFYTSPNGQTTYSSPIERFRIDQDGNVKVLSGSLDVNGPIYQRGVLLYADYVFEPNYKLESIDEHTQFMWSNKHLKAIPKSTVDKEGRAVIEVGAHQRGIVEEIEKAHIYIGQLHKQIEEQSSQIKVLEERLTKLESINNAGK